MTDVAILGGTGGLGTGLARRLAAAGIPLTIGSRDAARADAAAAEVKDVASATVAGAANADAAAGARIVILTVPFAAQARTLADVAPVLTPEQIFVDTTVPLATAVGGKPTRMLGVWQGSAAEQSRELIDDAVPVVAALHSVAAAALADLDHDLDEDVLVCGDSGAAKREVAALIARIAGLRPINAGRLDTARLAESMTALMIGMNGRYKTQAGLRITGLPDDLWPQPAPRREAAAV